MKTRSMLTRTRRAAATPTLADKKRLIIEAEQTEQAAADASVDQSFAAVYDREYKRLTAHWPKEYEPLQAALDAWARPFDYSGSDERAAQAEQRARARRITEIRDELEDDDEQTHGRPEPGGRSRRRPISANTERQATKKRVIAAIEECQAMKPPEDLAVPVRANARFRPTDGWPPL